ncbi:DUF7534 family protein [Candidatus Halobonum tyrrellensis]|uniref:Uncharacterized protein n=1 Tax=Candidatus Halobonum tyrrellensis G22 TaxID=1324957 RepID=V4HDZ5_9EURY|nr:hypothetical protein [Candidatus Halobonum tyrrellensis]ESP88880.1 hypothetical protein K933_06877 [Candidatus Halobonum tyrrellensis G22]
MAPIAPLTYALFALAVGVTLVPVVYWVSRDAAARGSSSPSLWGAFTAVSGVVGLYYLLVYAPRNERSVPPSRGERAAATVVVADVGAMLVGALLAPPDPFTQLVWWLPSVVLLLPVAYPLVYRQGYRRLPVVGSV